MGIFHASQLTIFPVCSFSMSQKLYSLPRNWYTKRDNNFSPKLER